MRSATAILGSPFPGSSSEKIVSLILDRLSPDHWTSTVVDLSEVPADNLLLRSEGPALRQALDKTTEADLIIPASPTYRATYTGLLKVFFDLMPPESLLGSYVLPVQTGGSPHHSLSIEYGMVPMVRSLGGLVLANSIYTWSDHWNEDGSAGKDLVSMIESSVSEISLLLK
jgi:FMN reductase